MRKVCQNSFFEEITPAAVICSRGEPFYLGTMTHPPIFFSVMSDKDFHSFKRGMQMYSEFQRSVIGYAVNIFHIDNCLSVSTEEHIRIRTGI